MFIEPSIEPKLVGHSRPMLVSGRDLSAGLILLAVEIFKCAASLLPRDGPIAGGTVGVVVSAQRHSRQNTHGESAFTPKRAPPASLSALTIPRRRQSGLGSLAEGRSSVVSAGLRRPSDPSVQSPLKMPGNARRIAGTCSGDAPRSARQTMASLMRPRTTTTNETSQRCSISGCKVSAADILPPRQTPVSRSAGWWTGSRGAENSISFVRYATLLRKLTIRLTLVVCAARSVPWSPAYRRPPVGASPRWASHHAIGRFQALCASSSDASASSWSSCRARKTEVARSTATIALPSV